MRNVFRVVLKSAWFRRHPSTFVATFEDFDVVKRQAPFLEFPWCLLASLLFGDFSKLYVATSSVSRDTESYKQKIPSQKYSKQHKSLEKDSFSHSFWEKNLNGFSFYIRSNFLVPKRYLCYISSMLVWEIKFLYINIYS